MEITFSNGLAPHGVLHFKDFSNIFTDGFRIFGVHLLQGKPQNLDPIRDKVHGDPLKVQLGGPDHHVK